MKRAPAISCCWPAKATKIIKCSRIALFPGMIAGWRRRCCVNTDSIRPVRARKRPETSLAPSAQFCKRVPCDGVPRSLEQAKCKLAVGPLTRYSCQKEELSEPVNTNTTLGFARKANPLRHLCGGRLHKWLAYWWRGPDRGLIPWPGWPASRLILARYVPANCLWPSTDRVTMDTITLPERSNVAPWQLWWPRRKWVNFRTRFARSASSSTTPSWRLSSLPAPCAKHGAAKLPGSLARWVKPRPKRSWRHFLDLFGRGFTDRKSTRLNSSHQIISDTLF